MEQPKNRVNFRALATVIVEYRSRATSLTYACVTPISSATVTWVTPAREIAVATRLVGGEARRTASCRSVSIQETTIREERRRSCRTHELRPHPKTHECWPNGQRVWMPNRASADGTAPGADQTIRPAGWDTFPAPRLYGPAILSARVAKPAVARPGNAGSVAISQSRVEHIGTASSPMGHSVPLPWDRPHAGRRRGARPLGIPDPRQPSARCGCP